MGMIGNYRRITPNHLAELQEEPDSIVAFLFSDDTDLLNERYLDIDKAWHGIHFLLTGTEVGGEPPLKNAVLGGGKPLGDPENPGFDFGPACFLTPDEVQEVAEALGEISEDDLKARFNPSALAAAHIYPSETWEPRTEYQEYLMSHYVRLVEFFQAAAKSGDVVLFYIA